MIGNTVQYTIHYDNFMRLAVVSAFSYVCQWHHVSQWKCDFAVYFMELTNQMVAILSRQRTSLWELLSNAVISVLVRRYEMVYYQSAH